MHLVKWSVYWSVTVKKKMKCFHFSFSFQWQSLLPSVGGLQEEWDACNEITSSGYRARVTTEKMKLDTETLRSLFSALYLQMLKPNNLTFTEKSQYFMFVLCYWLHVISNYIQLLF